MAQTCPWLADRSRPPTLGGEALPFSAIIGRIIPKGKKIVLHNSGPTARAERQRMQASPLMDGAAFSRDIGVALRQMWRAWCVGPEEYQEPLGRAVGGEAGAPLGPGS